MMRKKQVFPNKVGIRFGYMVVESLHPVSIRMKTSASSNSITRRRWVCRCLLCNGTKIFNSNHLADAIRRGGRTTCGCKEMNEDITTISSRGGDTPRKVNPIRRSKRNNGLDRHTVIGKFRKKNK